MLLESRNEVALVEHKFTNEATSCKLKQFHFLTEAAHDKTYDKDHRLPTCIDSNQHFLFNALV